MELVGELCPLFGADGASQHTVVDVVEGIGACHLPFHYDGILLRSRRGLHLADVAAGGQVAGDDIRIELLAGIRGLHAVVFLVADGAVGVETGRGGVLVYVEAVVQRAPLVFACGATLYGPVLTVGLHTVFPREAHGILVAAVLRQLDGHFELGVRGSLFPQGGRKRALIRQAGELVLIILLQQLRQEHHAVDVLMVVFHVGIFQFQRGGIAGHGA